MANIIGIKDIDDAIADLNYKNETTLKYRLVRAVRSYYEDDTSLESVKTIDAEELVKIVWETGDDQELIKIKRKSFSSTKSSINNDLKKLYQSGKNQTGIIIGQRNVFDISDAAKDKALAGIADVLKEKGIENIGGMAEILAAVNETVKKIFAGKDSGFGQEEIDRIKSLINDISLKVSEPLTAAVEKAGEKEPAAAGEEAEGVAGRDTENIGGIAKQLAGAEANLTKALEEAGTAEGQREVERIKKLISDICGKIGLSVQEAALPGEGGDKTGLGEKESGAKEGGEEEAYLREREEILAKIDEAKKVLAAMGTGLGDSAEYDRIKTLLDEISGKTEETGQEDLAAGELTEEVVEVVEEVAGDEAIEEAAGGAGSAEEAGEGAAAGELTEEVVEVAEEVAGDEAIEEAVSGEAVEEVVEEVAGDEVAGEAVAGEGESVAEEILATEDLETVVVVDDEGVEGALGERSTQAAGEPVDEELRDRADILAELAAAAKALEKIGPDLSGSIYSEGEIREKAKLLSEEFDRYLSVREKFYNQHILVNGGEYVVGGENRSRQESPLMRVNLREFYIGKFPVTNALFEIFVEKTGYITTAERQGYSMVYVPRVQRMRDPTSGREKFVCSNQLQYKKVEGACWHRPAGPGNSLYVKRTHPVVQVSLEDACAFAAWTGKRIPTEAEWEAAARTDRGFIYPWGNSWQDYSCNLEDSLFGDTTPVDQYVKFENANGVADMLGNVLEWTLDVWATRQEDDEVAETYIVKGASWISDKDITLTDRHFVDKKASSNILGFRCIAI